VGRWALGEEVGTFEGCTDNLEAVSIILVVFSGSIPEK
jgi:hypothetical protein